MYFAYFASHSSDVTCSLNFRVLLNLPKQVPKLHKFGRAMLVACFMMSSET